MKYEWHIGSTPPILGEHSEAKHTVLRTYLKKYIEVVTAKPQREYLNITLVDGFSGGGDYISSKTGLEVFGSPFIFLKVIEAAQAVFDIQRRKGLKINAEYFFVDSTAPTIEYLYNKLKVSGYAKNLGNNIFVRHCEFNDICEEIINHIRKKDRSQRCIFLLDQYGYNQITFSNIRKIFSEIAQPEVLLTFGVDSLIRYLSENEHILKAVSGIDLNRSSIQDIISLKGGAGWRYIIQNVLYDHVIKQTGARYYTCFFIKSPLSHEAYWLLHLSQHYRARDEMALRHWEISNHFVHHGHSGLKMLGFDPNIDPNQIPMDFIFDDSDKEKVVKALMEELPPLIYEINQKETQPLTFEYLFSRICNDTPATSPLLTRGLLKHRDNKEIEIISPEGRDRPRAQSIGWNDLIRLPKQGLLFSTLKKPD